MRRWRNCSSRWTTCQARRRPWQRKKPCRRRTRRRRRRRSACCPCGARHARSPPTSRVRRSCTRRRVATARTAVARCANSAKISPRCWTWCRDTSRSSGMYGPSSPAATAHGSCSSQHRRDPSRGGWQRQGCWPRSSWPSTPTTARCIGSRASTDVPGWSLIVPRWRRGSVKRHACSNPWSTCSVVMCWRPRRCTAMIRRCRCSILGVARPRPGGYGRTCAMIVPPPVAIRRRCGIAIRPIARVSIRRRTCVASAGFGPLYESGQIVEAACWAHARRKFYDIYMMERSPMAAEAMQRIGALYVIERDIRGTLPVQRARVRQERAGPLLDALRAWLAAMLSMVSAKSELAGAIKYALVRWSALTRYRDDGRIEIDNNSAERSIRPLVLGRRNYLFAGSDSGGERAANIYSLIGTALLNSRDPYLYLRHVLERIAEHPINRVDRLLPWHVVLEEPAERLRA